MQWPPRSTTSMGIAGTQRWKNRPNTGGTSRWAHHIAFASNTGLCAPSTHAVHSPKEEGTSNCVLQLSLQGYTLEARPREPLHTRQSCQSKWTLSQPPNVPCTAWMESYSWGRYLPFLQEAGTSPGKAQSALPKQSSSKKTIVSKTLTNFSDFFFFSGLSISFMVPGAGCQHSALLTAPCNFCKCPVIKWWD